MNSLQTEVRHTTTTQVTHHQKCVLVPYVISDHIIPQQWPRAGGRPSGSLFKRFPQPVQAIPSTTAAMASIHIQPRRLVLPRQSTTSRSPLAWAPGFPCTPNQHQHRRWCLRFVSLLGTLPCSATFPAGDCDLIAMQSASTKFPAEILQSRCCNISPSSDNSDPQS
jgi:hypothetical protein